MTESAPNAPRRAKRRLPLWLTFIVLVVAIFYVVDRLFPPNTFDPFCTFDLTYRVKATIEVDGRQYTSEVIRQESRSRDWVAPMNSNGCLERYGTALSSRLVDNRVILLRSGICPKAKDQFIERPDDYSPRRYYHAMAQHRGVDLTRFCNGIAKNRPQPRRLDDGFVIDSADRPTRWQGFEFGDELPPPGGTARLVAATAEASYIWTSPTDDLDKTAPGVLKTYFEYTDWSESPEAILSFARRKKSTYRAKHY